MERYRDALIASTVALVLGVLFLVIVWAVHGFNAALAVGGTFWAAGALLGVQLLPERR